MVLHEFLRILVRKQHGSLRELDIGISSSSSAVS
jgi:hypothetical protein